MKEKYSLDDYKDVRLSGDFKSDIKLINDILKCDDILRFRTVKIAGSEYRLALFFMDGMSSGDSVASDIVRSVFTASAEKDFFPTPEYLSEKILYSGEIAKTVKVSDMLRAIICGDTLLIIEGNKTALTVNTKGFEYRSVSEPPDERVTEGPREGFCEVALLNTALLRRKLMTPDLCVKYLTTGRRSGTSVFVCWLGSLADKNLISRVIDRIERVDIDAVLDTNYLSELICDKKGSIFKTAGTTERPDVVAARLLEGRVAVIVDGTPVVMTLPYLFSENFQSDEDYYQNYLVGSIGRIIRVLSFFVAVFLPALYVALICFHTDLLPTSFLLTVTRLKTGVPLSSVSECVLLILGFEFLKEAGARAPQSTGQAISIVGGLVMGQAAVEARIVSAPMLIVVAAAGLCAAAVPRLKSAVFYLRFAALFSAFFLGLLGVMVWAVISLVYLFSLSSFGTDYTYSEKAPYKSNLKDTFIRASWRDMIKRPFFNKNKTRQKYEDG